MIMAMRVVVCFMVRVQETWGPKHRFYLMDLTSDLKLDPSLKILVSQLEVNFILSGDY